MPPISQPNSTPCRQTGVTLIELIFVIMILGVVGAIGSRFVVTTVDQYATVREHSLMANRARVAVEQITRELRTAVPHSLRASADGRCIEFMPLQAMAFYRPDTDSAVNTSNKLSQLTLTPASTPTGDARYLLLNPNSVEQVYATDYTAARAEIAQLQRQADGLRVQLQHEHQFIRHRQPQLWMLVAEPVRFCVVEDRLWRFTGYQPRSQMEAGLSNSRKDLMAAGVQTQGDVFSLKVEGGNRGTQVTLSLVFTHADQNLMLVREVVVRNGD